MKFVNTLWFLYFMVFPFYIFPPGSPQLADIILTVLFLFRIKDIFLDVKNVFTTALIRFVILVGVVNIAWAALLWDASFLQNTLYYVYNLVLILLISNFSKDIRFLKTTIWGIGCSLVLQVVLIPFVPDQGLRGQMFFSNPNQLGFWAMNVIIIFYEVAQMLGKYKKVIWALFLIAFYFITFSISRSAFLGFGLFLLFYIFYETRFLFVPVVIFSLLAGTYVYVNFSQIKAFEKVATRIETEDLSDDDADGRGYGRITKYPEYLFLGAGEGKIARFTEGLELHSSFGNVLFSYGFIAFFIFSTMHVRLFLYGGIRYAFPIISIFVLSLVYMTLRTSMFWVTFYFIYSSCETSYLKRKMGL